LLFLLYGTREINWSLLCDFNNLHVKIYVFSFLSYICVVKLIYLKKVVMKKLSQIKQKQVFGGPFGGSGTKLEEAGAEVELK
jgi:hypothetical protein